MTAPEACKLRSVAKATRAHSTRAKQPVETGAGGSRLAFVARGVDSTLFRERGCRGVVGTEADLRRRVRDVGLAESFFAGDRRGFKTWGVFAASPKAFSARLTTCVASSAFSFGLISQEPWCASTVLAGFLVVVEDFDLAEAWVGFRGGLRGGFEDSSLLSCRPWRSSFKEAEIAGVHVDTDATADRIASAWAVMEAICMCMCMCIRIVRGGSCKHVVVGGQKDCKYRFQNAMSMNAN